jgi:urea transport system permease protein
VIRWLYGRPLETLLATWGISLALIQMVRTIFGAQNVGVENPSWMSGGIQVLSNVVLPWSRVMIIAFAALVLVGMWLLLTRTRLGLFVRGVTQNREMASVRRRADGARRYARVRPRRRDRRARRVRALADRQRRARISGRATSSIRSWWSCSAASGQLAGTVYAALTLGFANKFLEAWSGAVIAKIVVLVFIIFFIQRRPQGLFALKGRAAET